MKKPASNLAGFSFQPDRSGGSGFRGFFRLDAGLVIGALRRGVAIDKLDDRHRRHVAVAEAGLQDADIAALTVLVAGAQHFEQLRNMLILLELRVGLTAGASAPEILVCQVIERIKALGAVSVRTMDGIEETIKFPLPKGLKIEAATGLELSQRRPETGSDN